MRQNILGTSTTYGGTLVYSPTTSFSFDVTIPLYIKTTDVPVRTPKLTEINTIPNYDEVGVSDWSAQALFYGGQSLLTTTISGFLITPTTTVTDPNTFQTYQQLYPTSDGTTTGTSLGLVGYSYGDIIWAYLQGKLNQPSPSKFARVDPTLFIDPYGNVYNNPIIGEFDCEYAISIAMQNFNMKLYLEV